MKLRYGKLTIPHEVRNGKQYIFCRCDCGSDVWMRTDKLERRASCGCLARERERPPAVAHRKRTNLKPPPELRATHASWRSMNSRCRAAKKGESWAWRYSGITVCDRWRLSFADFLADMGPRPSPKHSLDRYPNNAGNYEPGNVRWATMSEQNYNRRPRKLKLVLEHNGRSLSYPDVARITGLSISTIRNRVRGGWSAEQILTLPVQRIRRRVAVRAA